MADQCGPWVVDTLDAFGKLDVIPLTVDDPAWVSADTCIFDVPLSVETAANSVVIGNITSGGTGSINSSSVLSADYARVRDTESNISSSSDFGIFVTKIPFVTAQIESNLSVSALAGFIVDANAVVTSNSLISITDTLLAFGVASVNSSGNVLITGEVFGEGWTPVEIGIESWITSEGVLVKTVLDQLTVRLDFVDYRVDIQESENTGEVPDEPQNLWVDKIIGNETWRV